MIHRICFDKGLPLIRIFGRLEGEYKQIGETSYPSYEQITSPRRWDLRQIQEQAITDDETMLLEYSFASDKSYVWSYSRKYQEL